ncbi:cytochrome c oxidase cbb3-type subunit 3 [Cruoricaptor ignavus]|uniref:Cytochrome c oxidase cbb3-type subunit 3 n=1 Tax=Cruoricaptor ignavus TaxID=1118202 RepID=A0A1M6APF2_9FLAO|nr:cbb3-type cytochrome c oxidase N-terminal domain-containing protein [Cruoricaptor ignavus]SHI38342.1 cytochrome c oxidase cbb3-type subunit 3 [Cruoricaptor ignavus]
MKQRTPLAVTILTLFVLLIIFFYMFVQSSAFLSSPFFWGMVLITVIVAMINQALGDLIENEQFKKLDDEEKREYLAVKNTPYFQRLYKAAFKKQTASEEKDILIDHGFDGIMELDNQLPKWWLGLFYFGVAYCVIYLISFFLTDFANPIKEYEDEYKMQIAAVDEYMKTVPQATLETAEYSADNIEEGKELFQTNCVSCHSDGGRGGIGPNLTDNYWINQVEPSLYKNIFHIVWDGSPNNPSMRGFGKNGELTGNDIEKIAAYVYHINQEQAPITPAEGGAAPQGTEANWEKQQ